MIFRFPASPWERPPGGRGGILVVGGRGINTLAQPSATFFSGQVPTLGKGKDGRKRERGKIKRTEGQKEGKKKKKML